MLIISVWAYYLDFSHRRPPPISNHFVVYWGWSLIWESWLYFKWQFFHQEKGLTLIQPHTSWALHCFTLDALWTFTRRKRETLWTCTCIFLISSRTNFDTFFTFPRNFKFQIITWATFYTFEPINLKRKKEHFLNTVDWTSLRLVLNIQFEFPKFKSSHFKVPHRPNVTINTIRKRVLNYFY